MKTVYNAFKTEVGLQKNLVYVANISSINECFICTILFLLFVALPLYIALEDFYALLIF